MRPIPLKMLGTLVVIVVSLAIVLMTGRAMLRLDERSRDSALGVTREAVGRAVMQCYALEGSYPPSIRYLQDHYGLIIDDQQYRIYYNVVAGNIYPVIDIEFREDVQHE